MIRLVLVLVCVFYTSPLFAAASFSPGELLVRFHESVSGADRAALRQSEGASVLEKIPEIGVELWKLAPGADPYDEGPRLTLDERVEYAEPNWRVSLHAPNDTLLSSYQYSYSMISADTAFEDWVAGNITLVHPVKVAVIDTGIDDTHSEFTGVIDTVNARSWDPSLAFNQDDNGHGTFVSGIIGAATDNGSGMAGVFFAPGLLTILPLKIAEDASLSDISNAILYAAGQSADVINLSLGIPTASLTFEKAVNFAANSGVLVVASTGNEGADHVDYPAFYSNAMAVGSLAKSGLRAFYSNFGEVELVAPGGDGGTCSTCGLGLDCCLEGSPPTCATNEIMSTASSFVGSCGSPDQYTAGAGTSFSAPMVVAAAALLLAQDNTRSPADLRRILTQSADPTGHGSGYHNEVGWGLLNVHRALLGQTIHSELAGSPLKAYNWPNPFSPDREGFTHVTFVLVEAQDVKVRIYDQAGELVFVRDIPQAQAQVGMNTFTWDGRNGKGDVVGNGSYLLRVSTSSGKVTHWIAVLR